MFCPNCGKDCGDAKFCPECGQKLKRNRGADLEQFQMFAEDTTNEVTVSGNMEEVSDVDAFIENVQSLIKTESNANLTLREEIHRRNPSKLAASQFCDAENIPREVCCPHCYSTSFVINEGYQSRLHYRPTAVTVIFDIVLRIIEDIRKKKYGYECVCLRCGYTWYPKVYYSDRR